ncbi:MAG: CHAT domain-containing protein [Cyanobacteria bacterium J06559_3]
MNIEQAIINLQIGLDIEECHLDLNLANLAEEQRQAYTARLSGTTNRAISLHLQTAPDSPEAVQLALITLLRRKGRILDAGTNSLQVLRQNLTLEDQATLDQLTTVRQELAALVFNVSADMPAEDYQVRVAQLETEANQLEATLARRSAAFRAESEPVEIAAVQAQIPANGVLVEYVRYRPFDAAAESQWGEARYAAYLLFPDGRIEAVDLGTAAEIDAAVQAFSRDLRTVPLPVSPADEGEGEARQLSALIFDPIAPYLADQEHLLISPDSQLNRIPFEALQTEAGGGYLVQQYQISYLTSGRDLLKLETTAPSTAPALILANPNYDTADATVQVASENDRRSAELSQLQVGPLPGTAAEAAAIAALLPNANVLTEDQATENALKAAQAPRILHIATHGFFLADVERSEETQNWLSARSIETPLPPIDVGIENPLLRSGLALAGFNARQSGSEDGVLTALEAANLNLFGTQLVVLSACETGLGDIANGEGVYGLRRTFSIAGAESQLMSLWLVSDDGTHALMARYYEKLMSGMGRSEALRATQLEMIAEDGRYSHPYYWASFILAGNWRPLE